MRAALWFLALFGTAVAVALFVGNNQGTVTVFWPPYRVDFSLNMVVLLLLGGFTLLYGALRGLSTLLQLPVRARRWRLLQKERAMHGALLEALSHMLAGRFLRARKAAESAIAQEQALQASRQDLPHGLQLRTLAHLVAAESSHALQDRNTREEHLQLALDSIPQRAPTAMLELHEGAQLRAARWSLDERDASTALERLSTLPPGTARRTLALRARLKAARLSHQTEQALETARLLGKHRAFTPAAAESIVRGLATELINGAHDPAQLQRIWLDLESGERAMPEIAVQAAQRLAQLGGEATQVRAWLLPVWEHMGELPDSQQLRVVRALAASMQGLDAPWLARIEAAQQADPRNARLQYLSAMACLHRELWGKAQQLLTQATQQLTDAPLRADAWRHLARLAEQRGDTESAARAWKQAAQQ